MEWKEASHVRRTWLSRLYVEDEHQELLGISVFARVEKRNPELEITPDYFDCAVDCGDATMENHAFSMDASFVHLGTLEEAQARVCQLAAEVGKTALDHRRRFIPE